MTPLLITLLTVLVIGVVIYFAFWMVDRVGLPHPFNMVAKVIILIIGLVALFQSTGLFHGVLT